MTLAITGGRVWDGTGAEARPATVLIDGARIQAVGSDLPIADGVERIDATGKTVLPGLIDMHVHVMLCGDDCLYGFLGTGITSVRDVGGDPDVLLPLREALAAGERTGPRLFVYGPMLDGVPPIFGARAAALSRLTRVSATREDGESTVRALIGRGVDGVKLYAGLRPDLVGPMLEAVGGRVPVAGHLGRTWASEAIELGIDTLEHVHATLYQDVVRPEDRHTREGGNGVLPNYWSWLSQGWARADLDAEHVRRFIAQVVEHQVVISPTTVLITGGMATNEAAEEPGQRYRPRSMSERMQQTAQVRRDQLRRAQEEAEKAGRPLPAAQPVDPDVGLRARANELELLRRLHEAGGIIVPSTDVGAAPLQVPGFALHRELALLVEAGIPARDVLLGVTRTAACALRRGDELGTLEPGKRADLIVVDGDPLQDISATRRVVRVVKDGRAHDPRTLLERIET